MATLIKVRDPVTKTLHIFDTKNLPAWASSVELEKLSMLCVPVAEKIDGRWVDGMGRRVPFLKRCWFELMPATRGS